MKITTVKFGQLRSYGEFQNMTIEAEALVEEQESPESALEQVRSWVANQLAEAIEMPRISSLQIELKALMDEYRAVESRRYKAERQAEDLELSIRKLRQRRIVEEPSTEAQE